MNVWRRCSGIRCPMQRLSKFCSGSDMLVEPQPWGWQVRAASFRFDIAIEVDLIEEIARIHGYDHIEERAGPADHPTRYGQRQCWLASIV